MPAKIQNGYIRNMYIWKYSWIGHILCRNSILKHVIEGKVEERIEVTTRRKQLLYDIKETRGYWKMKVDTLITFCGELTLEEAMDLSYDRLGNEWNEWINIPISVTTTSTCLLAPYSVYLDVSPYVSVELHATAYHSYVTTQWYTQVYTHKLHHIFST